MESVLPRITVVTPSYNQVRYLEATIRSVVAQGYADLEYVVVDGGSTDGSVRVLQAHAAALGRWVSEPDAGHADAINKGFAGTSGEIMAWINASDAYYPWTLSTVAEVFTDVPEAQWIVGMPTILAEGDGPKWAGGMRFTLHDFLAPGSRWLQQESVFWRRSLWEAAGAGLDVGLRYACDFELWTRFIQLAPLYHVEVPIAGWRVHDSQRSLAAKERYEEEVARVREALRGKLGRREGEAERAADGHALIQYDFAAGHWFAAWE